jgi:hypothetical protein
MAKNKYDFIIELLENNKLNDFQKHRVLLLSAEEMKKDKELGNVLEDRVYKLEERLGLKTRNEINEDTKVRDIDENPDRLPKFYFNPQYTYRFLRDYNQDNILTTTCHLVDSSDLKSITDECETVSYNFSEHYKLICLRFDQLSEKYNNVNNKLIALIRGYLTGKDRNGNSLKDGWASNIRVNWGMKELSDWSIANPGIPPNPDNDLPFNSFDQFDEFEPKLKLVKIEGIHLKRIQDFSLLTLHFKYLFHLRIDNNIHDIIENNLREDIKNKIDFSLEDLDRNIEFFTDIDKLIQTFEAIISLILVIKNEHNLPKPIVKLKFYRDEDDVCFSIHHINTVFKRGIEDIHRLGKNILGIISNQINGLGEFEAQGVFPDNNCYSIKYWDFKVFQDKKPHYKKIDNVEGVEYIIRMKR